MCQLSVSSTAACDSLQIGRSYFLNGGLHLDFGLLQWLQLVKIRKAQNERKTTPWPLFMQGF